MLKEPIQQEWVSYLEAERYSGLSHTTLWRYVNTGELRASRVGRCVRLHLPSLQTFMEERTGVVRINKAAGASGGEECVKNERSRA
jgi:excisionase family DNA binding protein